MAIPHSLISTGQKWINSASVQLVTPLASVSGAIISHFILDDEKFNINKFYSLLFSIFGVFSTGYPPFRISQTNPNQNSNNVILGYILILSGMTLFGFAPVFLRWKVKSFEITFNVVFQLLSSLIFCFIWSLVFDGWIFFKNNLSSAPLKGFIWPIGVGIIISGICIHGYMYLVDSIGAFGSNLLPFGQILVGVTLGVLFLKEWNGYTTFEIIIVLFGIVFLLLSMFFWIQNSKRKF